MAIITYSIDFLRRQETKEEQPVNNSTGSYKFRFGNSVVYKFFKSISFIRSITKESNHYLRVIASPQYTTNEEQKITTSK